MAIPLKYATASQEIILGHFVDSGDGNTEETGLTIANTDIKLWKNGAVTLANKNSGGATHISNGIYYATLDDTDTGTLGPMVIFVHVTGALPVRLECMVYPADYYDAIVSTGLNAIADAILKRDFSSVSGESARSALNALRFLRNKWSIAGTTLTVTKENDSTTAWTSELSTDAGANPVTGSDPA